MPRRTSLHRSWPTTGITARRVESARDITRHRQLVITSGFRRLPSVAWEGLLHCIEVLNASAGFAEFMLRGRGTWVVVTTGAARGTSGRR